jgi:SAM-dependent methyltransferase
LRDFCAAVLSTSEPPQSANADLAAKSGTEFDRKYGVNTGGVIPLSNLNLDDENWIFGGLYQPVGATVDFGEILKGLGISYEDFVFIDLGSGKGRAVLLAASLPFKKVVGIEFSTALNRIAEDNVRRWPYEEKRCGEIELIEMDAGKYNFPESSFVLYVYNPFERPVMERVVRNVTAAFQEHPKRIVILYFTPKLAELWEGVGFLKRVFVQPGYHVYDTVPASI